MPKPSITKRTTKGAALTYSELDTNFQNLADATVSLTAGTGGTAVTADLNGNITLVAGTGITLTGNDTAKTITITGTANITGLTDPLTADLDTANFFIKNTSSAYVNIREYLRLGDGVGSAAITTQSDKLLQIFVSTIDNAINLSSTGITIGSVTGTGSINLNNQVICNKRFTPPVLTTGQRDSSSPTNGNIIYNSTTNKFQGYANGTWVDLH